MRYIFREAIGMSASSRLVTTLDWQHHGGVDVDAVADELYALPREEFTAARDARARAARAAGDRDLATAIGTLRRPTSAAWVANLLARERPGEVRDLTEFGATLREAHATLDGATLQELSRQRHQVVHALVQQARTLGRDAGNPVSEAVAREVEETVTAALSDPDAARALAAGRLATALSPSAGWFTGAGAGTVPRPAGPGSSSKRTDDGAQQRVAQELAEVRAAAQEAADAQREAHRGVEDAERRAREAAGTVEDLARRLAAAEQARHAADQEMRFARRAVEDADRQVEDTERRIRDLERRIGPG